MPRTSRQPSLLKDIGAIADLYIDLVRLAGRRATGHSTIITYSPPEEGASLQDLVIAEEADRLQEAPSVR